MPLYSSLVHRHLARNLQREGGRGGGGGGGGGGVGLGGWS